MKIYVCENFLLYSKAIVVALHCEYSTYMNNVPISLAGMGRGGALYKGLAEDSVPSWEFDYL